MVLSIRKGIYGEELRGSQYCQGHVWKSHEHMGSGCTCKATLPVLALGHQTTASAASVLTGMSPHRH
jgi:hypothetical protein